MTELKEDKDLGLRLCKSCMRLQVSTLRRTMRIISKAKELIGEKGRVAELRNRDWHGDVFDEEKQA